MIRTLDLFSGVGGFSLGLKRTGGFRTDCYVEIDSDCQEVIKERAQEGRLDVAPIWDDVRSFDGRRWRGSIDLVCGGFPCQDISIVGKGAGLNGERSGLWREMRRVIREVRPRYVLVENVAALRSRGLDRVLGDLAELGFNAEWSVVSACSMGAPHPRKRMFIVAYPEGLRWEQCRRFEHPEVGYQERDLHHWKSQPEPVRVVDGIPRRVDRVKACGNSVVPQVIEWIGRRIMRAVS
jgi:DNA (cytosine-5)-methyltransferase 1